MTELINIAQQLLKIEKEFDDIKRKTFWKLYVAKLKEEDDRITDRCRKNKEDQRFYQGKARLMEDIWAIPTDIIKRLREKRGSE
jgi:DNA-binding transcriptional regulator PaaX